MRLARLGGVLAACLLAAACATTAPPPRVQAVASAPPEAPTPSLDSYFDQATNAVAGDFSALPGWSEEDHASALAAFQAGCRVSRDPGEVAVCQRAQRLGRVDEPAARAFLEANFRPQPVADSGLLTAYFTPLYPASRTREGPFTAPVRPRPDPASPLATAERAAIETRPAPDALAWMKPEDLFFLQIQGSGVLLFGDGTRAKAVFAAANGAPFRPIAAPMRQMGLLPPGQTSGDAIRAWLADNRGPRADQVMRLDVRYVFFRLVPDDGAEPAGAAGATLIPGRAVAVDPARHAMGEFLWIDASAPTLDGAFPAYRRLAMALDTGGAIHGDVRADLYLGRGDAAGAEAGRVRHVLHMWRLTPVSQTQPAS